MTAQFDDLFRYQGVAYSVSGISEGLLFDPSQLGLQPVPASTACWRGYVATYAIAGSRLVLDALDVSLRDESKDKASPLGPPISGVLPTGKGEKYDMFNNHYEGLAYPLEYTGGLLLAEGFIQELYVHMGFHPAWKYKNVVELVFENGLLQTESDLSARMAEIRQRVLDSQRRGDTGHGATLEDIRKFVDSSFDRTYTMY